MKQAEAGRRAGRKDSSSCAHGRMLADEYGQNNQRTGNLICRECGAIVPDPRPEQRQ
jgi:hypothetical protein